MQFGLLLGVILAGLSPALANIAEDAFLNMTAIVTKYGYPIETHYAQTDDGYILTMYRIPYGRNCGKSDKPKIPVLLQHGLLSSSYDYIILGPKKSLGYILADKCYDVWMGNNRGTKESRKHIKMTASNKNFWLFSWNELGEYDIPAMVDVVLNVTKQPNLHYVGHSQGTTQFFVFGALRPEYHSKIRSMHALSPVVYMKHLTSPFVRVMVMFQTMLEKMLELVGVYEFLPGLNFLNMVGSEICKDQYPLLQGVCSNVMFLLCGFDEPQLNKTTLPAIIGHTPAGAATRQLIHYAQGIKTGHFKKFDFGIWGNLKKYNSIAPPEYNLKKIKIPIALYYGKNDFMAALKDVDALVQKLPNIIENYRIPYPKFSHLDFIFAIDGYKLVYERLLEVMAKH